MDSLGFRASGILDTFDLDGTAFACKPEGNNSPWENVLLVAHWRVDVWTNRDLMNGSSENCFCTSHIL